jgi:hypothetical protein
VITLVLSLADALRSRFAISPLGEAVVFSRAMALPSVFAQGTSAAWLRRHDLARRRLQREHDLRPLLALMAAGRRYFPDFLTQTDESAIGDIERELEEIRATPEERVRTEIEHALSTSAPVEWVVERQLRFSSTSPSTDLDTRDFRVSPNALPSSSGGRQPGPGVRHRSRSTHAGIEGGHDVVERAQR